METRFNTKSIKKLFEDINLETCDCITFHMKNGNKIRWNCYFMENGELLHKFPHTRKYPKTDTNVEVLIAETRNTRNFIIINDISYIEVKYIQT